MANITEEQYGYPDKDQILNQRLSDSIDLAMSIINTGPNKHPNATFEQAYEHIKSGGKAYRSIWNQQFIAYSPGMDSMPAQAFWSPANAEYVRNNGGTAKVNECLTMKLPDGSFIMGWIPIQEEVKAIDWVLE